MILRTYHPIRYSTVRSDKPTTAHPRTLTCFVTRTIFGHQLGGYFSKWLQLQTLGYNQMLMVYLVKFKSPKDAKVEPSHSFFYLFCNIGNFQHVFACTASSIICCPISWSFTVEMWKLKTKFAPWVDISRAALAKSIE